MIDKGNGVPESDSAPLESRRRDLYAVALGLILFQLAGAQVKAEASTFFGAFDLMLPSVIVVGAWTLLAYFTWRFLQKGWPFDAFGTDVDAEAMSDSRFQAFGIETMRAQLDTAREQRHGFNSYIKDRKPHQAGDQATLTSHIEQMEGYIKAKYHYQPKRGSWLRRLDTSLLAAKGAPAAVKATWKEHFKDERFVRLPWRTWMAVFSRAVPRAIAMRDSFADRMLPLICAIAAPVVALLRGVVAS